MKSKLLMLSLLIPVIFINPIQSQSQTLSLESTPYFFRKQFTQEISKKIPTSKKPGYYTKEDWAAIIDSTWGLGLPVDEKLAIFDIFTDKIDDQFACFQNLECDQTVIDWESLVTAYRQEVEDTVSRGRFAAIMHQLCLALKESHTYADDDFVMNGYTLTSGLPLLVVGGWGNNTHFGTGLTPLPDSNLLVYQSVENHILNLIPGDIVLGYDGIRWKELYKELIEVEMPIRGWWWGCSESAHLHSWLMSAGMNWHLFDTIDIVKYVSGDTLHLATSLLEGQNEVFYCSEQLTIPGIPYPDILNGELFSYGLIDGTDIGYIYGWGWFWEAEDEFYEAVSELMFNNETSGLIIDFRMNYGGNMFLSNKGLELLFNSQDSTIGFISRNNPEDHCSWGQSAGPGNYIIQGDYNTYYDKPIAVLTGPGAISSGDQVALRMKFHPMARLFGKSTAAAFNAPTNVNFGDPDWSGRYAVADAYLVSNPDNHLTHEEFEVDEYVWHTPEAVAQGKDAVVETAVEWINSFYTKIKEPFIGIQEHTSLEIYPNPVSENTTIEFLLNESEWASLRLFDITGKHLKIILSKKLSKGNHKINWNAEDLNEGIYFIRLETRNSSVVCKALITNNK